ncbi:MAG TPA: ShlB/FhaC/HecB family hemolysin secretion/activation protein, partial [Nitrospiraceae bacterium]|nr:ShlB/FhaC/HecB family hemolysin secretion/activation protein [Nitrospiraceae bacterium]
IPVYTSAIGEELLYLVPFFDYGRAWNSDVASLVEVTPSPMWLASVGVGTIWHFWRGSRFEVYWGERLNRTPQAQHTNLQDYGVHLQLVVEAF